MKHTLLFLFFFFTLLCNAQENCNNGIDDDGDGKIDLNDSDCICNSKEITSIIPNPSFEDFNSCPTGISQLNVASSWQQATLPTTDYFNTCGYINNAEMTPFPDGNGAVGAFFAKDWQEYLGACLSNPMKAGTSYQLTFNIASKPATGDVSLGDNGIINYGPIDIVIYGKAECTGFPIMTVGCPSSWDSSWVILGSINYTPVGEWGVLNITFTPSTNINTIILGSPCTLPPNYEWGITNTAPFFYFDNLLLNTSESFGVNINQTGLFCDNNLVLSALITKPVSEKKTFQWYKDGIAISGANKESYKVPSFATNLGKYSVKVTDGSDCFVSKPLTINNTIPGPTFTTVQPNCFEPTGTINILNPASQYSFDNGLTWQESSKKNLIPIGTHYIKIKTVNGCISSATGVKILEPQLLANSEFSVTQPTTCDGKGSININSTNAAEYSFDDGLTWTTTSEAKNLEPGNYLIKIKDNAGCQSSSQFVIINRIFLANPLFNTIQPTCGKGGQITINTVSDFYSFDDGKTWTTDPISKDLEPGTYLIKIKNKSECESNTVYGYIEPFYLKVYPAYTTTQPICGKGGTITITSEASEFSFDNGVTWSTNPVASDLVPGYYSILFKNELGCISYTQYVSLEYFYLPNPAFTFTKPTCDAGGSITITTIANEYSFDNGTTWTTNPTASNLKPGTYYIMIKNEIGCTSSTYHYVNLDYFFLPDPNYIAVNPSCGNIGSIEITTKADWYSFDGGYTWSADPKKTNLIAGYYYLKVKSNLGCESNNFHVYLDSYSLANPNYILTEATCTTQASITLTTKADFYSFDNGYTWTTNPILSNLIPNNHYFIKIKNSSDCMSNYLPIFIKPFYLENPLFTVIQPSCGNTGNITITTTADFYSFDNGNTWTTNPILSNLIPNNYYNIKIKNDLGCTSESQYVYTLPYFLDNPNYTVLKPSCGVSGNITITTKSDFYSFDNGATWTTNPILSNPEPNNYYYILIKNNLGCVSNYQYVYIDQYYLDAPSFAIEQPICGKDGTITISTISDQYSFDNGTTWNTNNVASNLKPGYYYIMIKNKLGCTSHPQYVYIEPYYLASPTYEVLQPTCESQGKITITTIADQYSFDNGYTWTSNPVLDNPNSNYFYIKIKNNKGCESNTQYAYINSPFYIPSKPNTTTVSPSDCGVKDGSITITNTGVYYSFDNGVTWKTSPNSGPLEAGTYQIRIKETDWGCPSAPATVVLNSKNNITAPTFSTIQPTCNVTKGKITINTAASEYSFDNGTTWQTGNSKDNILPGEYSVKIKNAKNCISEPAIVKISTSEPYKIQSYSSEQPLCNGGSTTGIVIKIDTPASEYSFDNGLTWSTNNIAKNLKENTEYCLKIKNAFGCISESSCMTTIKQVPVPKAPEINVQQPVGCDIKGVIIVNSAKAFYSFDDGVTWVKNQNSGPLNPGIYFVRTKETGSECISEAAEISINNPPIPPTTPEVEITQPTTCAIPFGTITITTIADKYSFDNGNTWTSNSNSGNLVAGFYNIKTKNAIGCESAVVNVQIIKPNDYPSIPSITVNQPDCSNVQGKITISSAASEYSFDNGATWNNSGISPLLTPGEYLVKVKNSNGCISEAAQTKIIPFTEFPSFPTATKTQTFCINENATLTNTRITGNNIKWYDAITAGNILANTTVLENRTYYASQNINDCESERLSIIIKIQDTQVPIADINQHFCIQENATINKIKINGKNIKWYNDLKNGINLSESTVLENESTYYASQTIDDCESPRTPIIVKILEATTSECINYVDELPYPKFFTPNNDGYNDTWTIDFAYLSPNTGIRIFDRYGKFIKELRNDTSWDGTYIGRDEPASDFWFMVIRLNGSEFRGHFSLKR